MTDDVDTLLQQNARSNEPLRKQIAAVIARYRDLAQKIEDVEEQLKRLKAERTAIERQRLPELMGEAAVDSMGIPAEGNMPAMDVEIEEVCHASIPVGWSPERKAAAFAKLSSLKLDAIVRNTVTAVFDKDANQDALFLAEKLRAQGIETKMEQYVPWSRLTSSVKKLRHKLSASDLDTLGAAVWKEAKIKPRKEI